MKKRRWEPLGPRTLTPEERAAEERRKAENQARLEARIRRHPKDGAFGYRRSKP